MFDFNGKVLWLTGANGAISRAIAKTFFGLGASCMLTDLDEAGVIGFAKSLDPSGKRAVGLKQDASRSEDAASAAEAIKTRFGKLDYLVTSAGLYPEQMINDMTDAQWRQALGVNLDGVFFTFRASIRYSRKAGQWSILRRWRVTKAASCMPTMPPQRAPSLPFLAPWRWNWRRVKSQCRLARHY